MCIYSKSLPPPGFYVYAYLRKSNLTPYYIGKGCGTRAWAPHHFTIPRDYTKIVILESGLTDIGALAIERRMIYWYGRKDMATGILQNRTDGGDGATGRIGAKLSNEFKEYLSNRWKLNNPGKNKSDATRKKISDALRGKTTRPCPQDVRMKISAATTGKIRSSETRKKLSEVKLGKTWEEIYGEETAARMKLATTERFRNINKKKIYVDGNIYESLNEASAALGMKPCALSYRTRSKTYPECYYL